MADNRQGNTNKRGFSFFDELTEIYRKKGGGALSPNEISELIEKMMQERKAEKSAKAKDAAKQTDGSEKNSDSKNSTAAAKTKEAEDKLREDKSKKRKTEIERENGKTVKENPMGDIFSASDGEGGIPSASETKAELPLNETDGYFANSGEESGFFEMPSFDDLSAMELPLDWENASTGDPRAEGVHTDSISDGMVLSLTTLGRVDIEYISSITGADYKTVILALKGSIYQNPETWDKCFYKGWEPAEEYLSGNIMRKYRVAERANEKYKGYFQENLDALRRVLPPTVRAQDIYVTLGSPWVPVDVIDEFVCHIMKLPKKAYHGTKHDEITGTWDLADKGVITYRNTVASKSTYGTPRLEAMYILERTLNMKTVSVTDEVVSKNRGGYFGAGRLEEKKRVINKAETLLAIEKQRALINEFQNWIWKDERRKERLEEIFESKFGCVRRRIF